MSLQLLTDRVKRLKDARTEADEEIEAYRKAKDQEFSAFQSSVSSVRIASALTYLAYHSSMLGQHRMRSPLSIRIRRRRWAR